MLVQYFVDRDGGADSCGVIGYLVIILKGVYVLAFSVSAKLIICLKPILKTIRETLFVTTYQNCISFALWTRT